MIGKLLNQVSWVSLAAVAVSSLPVMAAPASTNSIEEVVITAQRREEKLQSVPLSVTALSANALKLNDVRDITRIEVLTPGFTFGRSGSDARPAIRGVRTENVGVSGDPTIGFYVDGIYQTRASQSCSHSSMWRALKLPADHKVHYSAAIHLVVRCRL